MILKKWEKLPEFLKNKEVEKYYTILKKKQLQLFLKRILDIILALLLLFFLSPIFVIIAIAIKIDSKGPVFYRQERVTQYGRLFRIFKFRTMIQDADKKGVLVTIGEDSRITNVGKRIRKYRIDEIPQLINVLIGDMSFVGTRPEVKKYVDCYTNEMNATLLLPAGITSRASIEFKDEDKMISEYLNKGEKVDDIYVKRILPEKMKWNLTYIEEFSLIEDVKIDIQTVIKVGK